MKLVTLAGQKYLYSGGPTTMTSRRGSQQFGGILATIDQYRVVPSLTEEAPSTLTEDRLALASLRSEDAVTYIRCARRSPVPIRRRKT